MTGIIDLCGNMLDLSTLKDFKLGVVEYIYQPGFREINCIEESRSIFGRAQRMVTTSRIEFYRMEPYGVVLGKYDGFDLNSYYPQTLDEAIKLQVAETTQAVIHGIGDLVTDLFHQNVSETKQLRIRRRSGTTEINRLRDIPVKIHYASGQNADVGKNDAELAEYGNRTNSSIEEVPVLLVTADKPIVVYGNGIDTDDVRGLYDKLIWMKQEEIRLEEARKKEEERLRLER